MSLYFLFTVHCRHCGPGYIVYIFVMTHLSVFACWCKTTRCEVVDFTRAEVFLRSSQQQHQILFWMLQLHFPCGWERSARPRHLCTGVRVCVCLCVCALCWLISSGINTSRNFSQGGLWSARASDTARPAVWQAGSDCRAVTDQCGEFIHQGVIGGAVFLSLSEVVRLWPALLFYHRCILNNEAAESRPGGSESEPPWRMRSSSMQSAVAERLRKSSWIPRLSAECEYLRLSAECEYPGAPKKNSMA